LFQREIKKSYPQMKLIFTCPPEYQGPSFDEAWSWVRKNRVDTVDEHIYASYEGSSQMQIATIITIDLGQK